MSDVRPPEGTRLVLVSDGLFEALGADRVEWGEPDEHGWYTPTLTKLDPTSLVCGYCNEVLVYRPDDPVMHVGCAIGADAEEDARVEALATYRRLYPVWFETERRLPNGWRLELEFRGLDADHPYRATASSRTGDKIMEQGMSAVDALSKVAVRLGPSLGMQFATKGGRIDRDLERRIIERGG